MNRELKFRVWDKLEKRFIYPDKGYQGHYVLDLNGRFQNLQNGSGGDEYVVQQWTGLTDSKGVDVYEGDRVRYEFNKNYFYYEVKWEYYRWKVVDEKDECSFLLINNFEEFEVIGNIFENPELLKQ